MNSFQEIQKHFGFELERELPGGHRFKVPSLNIRVDIWRTSRWGLVGFNEYGWGTEDLANRLIVEQNRQSAPKSEPTFKPTPKQLLVGLLETKEGKGSTCEVVYIGGYERGTATQELEVISHRECWRQAGSLGSFPVWWLREPPSNHPPNPV